MPVLMISTLTERGAEVTLKALELGAVDFVAKPRVGLSSGLSELAGQIVDKIRVAAAAEAADGTVFTGVNIENASYGLTVCAERNAVFRAIGEGQRDLLRMAVVTDSPLVQSPCGACRQVLFECNPEMLIDFYGPEGFHRQFIARELLPDGFTL